MFPGRKHVWKDNDLRGAVANARGKTVGNTGLRKFHMRGMYDGRVVNHPAQDITHTLEHVIGFFPRGTVIDEQNCLHALNLRRAETWDRVCGAHPEW